MIVYHGSKVRIEKPDLKYSRVELDFGRGFYVTEILDQAKKWSERKNRDNSITNAYGVVSKYELSDEVFDKYKILKFEKYTKEWLEYITICRRNEDKSDYDIVMGGVANDKVYDTIELYFDNLISVEEAIGRLKYEEVNNQICIRRQEILDKYLRYVEVV